MHARPRFTFRTVNNGTQECKWLFFFSDKRLISYEAEDETIPKNGPAGMFSRASVVKKRFYSCENARLLARCIYNMTFGFIKFLAGILEIIG